LNINSESIQYVILKDLTQKYTQNIVIKINHLENKYYLSEFKIIFNKFNYLFYTPYNYIERLLNLLSSDDLCISFIVHLFIYYYCIFLVHLLMI
jgi:hypothetical protein